MSPPTRDNGKNWGGFRDFLNMYLVIFSEDHKKVVSVETQKID
jgi:hypothetical protein